MEGFEIKKLQKREFKDYELEYLKGCDSMTIKRFTESCGI